MPPRVGSLPIHAPLEKGPLGRRTRVTKTRVQNIRGKKAMSTTIAVSTAVFRKSWDVVIGRFLISTRMLEC